MNLYSLLSELTQCSPLLSMPVVLSGYCNPFLQYGLEALARDAVQARVQALQVFDLPQEESGPLQQVLDAHELSLIPSVGSNSSDARLALYAARPSAFVQLDMVWPRGQFEDLGVLGAAVKRVRSLFQRPTAVRLQDADPADVAEMPADARPDIIILDKNLMAHVEAGGEVADFLQKWR